MQTRNRLLDDLARVAAGIKDRGSSSLVVFVLEAHQVCAEKGEETAVLRLVPA